jgi:hypothetical protein
MIAFPDPVRQSSQWVSIPPAELSIPLFPADEDQAVAYLVICPDGCHALALAGRRSSGCVTWSGNVVVIDAITNLLADVGTLKRAPRKT